jgi:hypothetical protein
MNPDRAPPTAMQASYRPGRWCLNRRDLLELAPALSDQFQAAILIKGQARTLSTGKISQVLVLRKLKDKEQIQVA